MADSFVVMDQLSMRLTRPISTRREMLATGGVLPSRRNRVQTVGLADKRAADLDCPFAYPASTYAEDAMHKNKETVVNDWGQAPPMAPSIKRADPLGWITASLLA